MPSDFDPELPAMNYTKEDEAFADVQFQGSDNMETVRAGNWHTDLKSLSCRTRQLREANAISRSQQERIGQLEDVVRAFACVTVPLHTEFARSITCDSDYGIHVRKLMDTPVVRSLLSKPEGESAS